MRIGLLVNYDLASSLALKLLCQQLPDHQLSIFYTRKPAPANLPRALLELGKFEHTYLYQNGLIDATLNNVIETSQLNTLNTDGYEALKASQPDLLICVRYMNILKEKAIQLPQHGVINLHSGQLPQYQGVMASFWAMLAGEEQLGSSLHYIEDNTIDTGRIIEQSYVDKKSNKSYLWNVLNLYLSGCDMIIRTVNLIEKGLPIKAQQQQGKSGYYSYPDQKTLDEFALLGNLYDENDLLLLEKTNNFGG